MRPEAVLPAPSTAPSVEKAPGSDGAAWKAIVARFARPSAARASWQLINTLGSYAAVWVLIAWSLTVSWWLTVPLAVLAGGLMIRVFILFHDCGHGSFFASPRANAFWGFVTGLLTFTPYYHWRWEHAIHHGTTGDLDRRGIGDIWTMTVQEYVASTRWKKLGYRVVRNPIVLFVIAPLVLLAVMQRFSRSGADARERHSVWIMNAAIAVMVAAGMWLYGPLTFLIVLAIALATAGSAGIWLFYVQHQFEDAYWERGRDWDFAAAALQGSSYFRLPRVLQWFSGSIGFHHIHHLSPRIPNYHLEACHRSDPLFEQVKPMSMWSALRTLGLRLWCESSKRLVGWRALRSRRPRRRDA
jgi:acyl-lipid omega-6 desaturase (Delta-12 desaturase)